MSTHEGVPVDASPEDVTAFEARVDSAFVQQIPPSATRELSIWSLTTALEDKSRLLLATIDSIPRSMDVIGHLDRFKYGYKHGLSLLMRQTEAKRLSRKPVDVSTDEYLRSQTLLTTCVDYQMAIAAFSSYREGRATCSLHSATTLLFEPTDLRLEFSALEMLENLTHKEPSPLRLFPVWLNQSDLGALPDAIQRLIRKARVVTPYSIDYEYDPRTAADLADEIPQGPQLLPDGLATPYGTGGEVRRMLHGLQVLAAYHLLSVYLGAAWRGIQGYGYPAATAWIARDGLVSRVSKLSGVSRDAVAKCMRLLTYDVSQRSPDPALQPLLEIGAGAVAFAPTLILSSNAQRNFLVLLSRTSQPDFDSASHVFAKEMSATVRKAVERRPWQWRESCHVPGRKDAGEVDFIIADQESRTVMVLELKWTIPPGETREVHRRERLAEDAVQQAQRKLDAVRQKHAAVLALLDLPLAATDTWEICACVVIQGYAPTSSKARPVPVTTVRQFLDAVEAAPDLAACARWLSSDGWLPRQGVHFTVLRRSVHFAGLTVKWKAVLTRPEGVEWIRAPKRLDRV